MPTFDEKEKRLVEGCVNNDRRCQEALYRKFFATMYPFVCRYTSDKEEALHIVNSGFLRVFKKIHQFGFKGSLEGWIRRIMFHAVANHFRSQKNKIQFMTLEDFDKPEPATQLHSFYEDDILKMIDLLPNASGNVFKLFALEGYTHAEIGDQLSISVGTSKWHLSEARKRLKELIAKQTLRKNAE